MKDVSSTMKFVEIKTKNTNLVHGPFAASSRDLIQAY